MRTYAPTGSVPGPENVPFHLCPGRRSDGAVGLKRVAKMPGPAFATASARGLGSTRTPNSVPWAPMAPTDGQGAPCLVLNRRRNGPAVTADDQTLDIDDESVAGRAGRFVPVQLDCLLARRRDRRRRSATAQGDDGQCRRQACARDPQVFIRTTAAACRRSLRFDRSPRDVRQSLRQVLWTFGSAGLGAF